MPTVAELLVKVHYDDKQVESGLEGTKSKLGGALGTIGGLAAKGALALGSIGAAGVAMGLNTASGLQQSQIAFETMLGSADKAHSMLDDLANFAKTTPFEFSELVPASQKMLAMGFSADKVLPILTTVGDTAAGLGAGSEGVNRITTALGQMQAKGKISTEEMMQLTELGIPAFQILADKVGMTVPQLQDMMSKAGGVGAQQLFQQGGLDFLIEGLQQGTEHVAGFGGMMEKQSHTFGGAVSNLKDTVEQGLAKAVMPLLPFATTVATKVGDAIGPIFDGVVGGLSGLGARIQPFLGPIGDAIGSVWDKLSGIDWGSVLGKAVDFIKPLADGFKSFAGGGLKLLVSWWQMLSDLIRNNIGTIERVATIVRDVLAKAFDIAGGAMEWVSRNMELVKAIAAPLLAGFLAYQAVTGIMNGIRIATDLWKASQAALNVVMSMNPIMLVVIAIAALAAGVIYAYTHFETFRNIIDTVGQVIGTVMGTIWTVIQTVFNWIVDHWPLLAGVLFGPIGLAVGIIIQYWDQIKAGATAVKDWIVDRFNDVTGFIKGIPGQVSNIFSTLFDPLRNAATSAKDWIGQRIDDVVSFARNLPSRLSGLFVGMWDGIGAAFRAAINYMIRGWNSLEFHVPGFKIGPVGYDGFTIGVPDIPYLAKGGIIARSGSVVVGDAGPELLTLPQGAAVRPLGGNSGANGGSLGSITNYMDVTIKSNDPEAVVDALTRWCKANGALPNRIKVRS